MGKRSNMIRKEENSARWLRGLTGAVFVAGLAVLTAVGNADAKVSGFSAASIKGGFGCVGNGSFSGVPFTELFQVTFDGIGIVSGTMNFNIDGEHCDLTLSGAYSVNADGTGKATPVLGGTGGGGSCTGGATEALALVVESNGAAIDFEGLDGVFVGANFTGSCKKQ